MELSVALQNVSQEVLEEVWREVEGFVKRVESSEPALLMLTAESFDGVRFCVGEVFVQTAKVRVGEEEVEFTMITEDPRRAILGAVLSLAEKLENEVLKRALRKVQTSAQESINTLSLLCGSTVVEFENMAKR
ncbi:MAG: hypothetical protein RMI44_06120 [Aquificaceae bacterium]|nr:hypothetical protein [Aquificaceae bacterium]